MPAGPVEGLTGKTVNGETLRVREVWADNLHEEIAIIRDIVEDYPYVAMDTEFPGVVARPVGNFKSSREYHYKVSTWDPDMVPCAACCSGWGRWLSAVGPVHISRPA
jgi:CCR4-NOT transcription complex subunit 7/8